MTEQKTVTFETKSTTAIGAICDMIWQATTLEFGFEVISVVPLYDPETEAYPKEYRIEYKSKNSPFNSDIAVLPANQLLYMIGMFAKVKANDLLKENEL